MSGTAAAGPAAEPADLAVPRPGGGTHAVRRIAGAVVRRAGGLPAVRTLVAVLRVYDRAGGGLVAGGLAYATLLALVPGLLLLLTVVGLLIGDPGVRADLVAGIARALPPVAPLAEVALEQVAGGAAPTSVLAIAGLAWGAGRLYGALDTAFAGVFPGERRRSFARRTARGAALTAGVILVPAAAFTAGGLASAFLDGTPLAAAADPVRAAAQVLAPAGAAALFVGGAALAYRWIPVGHVPLRALGRPALAAGLALAAFTHAFAYLAPRLVGAAAFYGAFVAAFALLAWLSVGYAVLLLGAAWTRVRLGDLPATAGGAASPAAATPGGASDAASGGGSAPAA